MQRISLLRKQLKQVIDMTQELLTKCSRCEAEIRFTAGINIINCPYCGRPNSRPKSAPTETSLMKYANERRNIGEFKEAESAYRQVLQACTEEHEARWGLLLCKYGVMYVESEGGKERLITCRRGRNSAFRSEPDYQTVLSQAPAEVRKAYEQDGEYIDRIQAEIRRLRRAMEPYQVFICYKETGANGQRTEDSVLAQGIYNALTRRKYRVFYAPVSLKNLAGANYEAAIFCAIESSPLMLVVGTKKEYLDSTWVRSEWSRFLELCDRDEAADRLLIPLYRDLDPSRDLPREFLDRYLEALNMRNPGYMFDVEDIISKVIKSSVSQIPVTPEPEKMDNRLTLVKLYLQVGDFQEAESRLEAMVTEQPENPDVWLYKAMLDEQIRREEDFLFLHHSLHGNSHFQMALSLAQGERRSILEQYQQAVENRLEKEEEARKIEELRKAREARKAEEKTQKQTKEKARKIEISGYNEKGIRYYNGEGVPQDYAEAVKWFRKAAEQGDATAQFNLGSCYYRGEGVPQDYAEAVMWYRKTADQGYAYAQNNLGNCYYHGTGVTTDYGEAVKWYRKAADQGYADAQNNLGYCYYHGIGVTTDYDEAVKWYRKAADQGYAKAQFNLGNCYYNGSGITQDYAEAVKWFRKAAEQGDATAQFSLGSCYYRGEGVPQDYAEAVMWYRKTADQGYAYAQNNLGNCYYHGIGVTTDYGEAVKWYRKAADQGYADAQNNLGNCYYDGIGVTTDYGEAVKWYRKAADQGYADAQNNLGYCYYHGIGVTTDYDEAVKWYRKAAEQGHTGAQKSLESLEHYFKIIEWKQNGLCAYCGGSFSLLKKCRNCGLKKDY